jgi:hypothetical protein
MNPGPTVPVVLRARASVKTLHIGVSTIAADTETTLITVPCSCRNPHRPDGSMIGAAEESVNANIRQS